MSPVIKNENRIKISLLFISIILVTSILVILYLNFKNKVPQYFLKNGGFARKYVPFTYKFTKKVILDKDTYTIIAADPKYSIIYGYKKNRIQIFSSETGNKKTTIELNKLTQDYQSVKGISYDVHQNLIYVFKSIFKNNKCFTFDVATGKCIDSVALPLSYTRGVRYQNRLAFIEDAPNYKSNISMYRLEQGKKLKKIGEDSVQIGSKFGIAVNGSLQLSADKLSYVSYYVNRYFVYDTLMNKIQNKNTVDTIQQLPAVASLRNNTIIKFLTPTRVVNEKHQYYKDNLVVQSNIASESKENLGAETILDFYNLNDSTKKYSHSMLVKGNTNEKAKEVYLFQNQLIMIFNDKLLIYKNDQI